MSMTESDSKEVATSAPKPLGVQLKEREKQFFSALPAHIPAERFMRVVMTAVNNNPALWHAHRQSFWNACMRAAQDGLLADGRDGALVIFKSKDGKDEKGKDIWIEKVQWMPMIGGIRKKVRNSGEIKDWNAQVVYAKDHFEFELGDSAFIKHRPFMGGDPGPVIAAYSIAQFKSGELSREVMTRAQIDKVRAVSKSKDSGPWVNWYEEMCRKTVARRHSKSLPMSSDLDDLIRRDDELYDLEGKSDKQIAGPHRTMTERLGLLAKTDDEPTGDASFDLPADLDTEILDNEPSSPSPAVTPAEQGQAAADARASVEIGAGGPSSGGDPAPDPQQMSQIPASNDDAKRDNEAAASTPAPGAPRSMGGEASPASPPATSPTAADEARKARVAEIKRDGQACAEGGKVALMNYLDELRASREDDLVSSTLKTSWHEIAKAVDAKKGARK